MRIAIAFLVLYLVHTSVYADSSVLKRVYVGSPEQNASAEVSIDPAIVGGHSIWQPVLFDLFQPLLILTPEGKYIPGAASQWSYSDDGRQLFIDLKENAVWSDGKPIVTDDYIFALERMRDSEFSPTPLKFLTTSIVGFDENSSDNFGVIAETPKRLKIELTKPYIIGEYELTHTALSPLPSHVAPTDRIPWSQWANPVSNGSYVLQSVEGTKVKLKRNPNAPANAIPYFDSVESYTAEWPEAAAGFLQGEIDYLYGIPERQLSWFKHNNIQTHPTSARIYYYAMNQKLPELADRRVRRALRLAIDRQALVDRLFQNFAKPAYSIIPVGVQGYEPDPLLVLDDFERDFKKAKTLMEEAGYDADNRLKLTISSNDHNQHRNIAEFVKESWSSIFVDVDIDIKEKNFRKWFQRFTKGDYVIGRRSWNSEAPLMSSFMDVCKALNDARCGYFDDPEYKALIAKAYQEEDIDRRRALFVEAERLIIDGDVIIPLFHGLVPIVLGDRIQTEVTAGFRTFPSHKLKLHSQ